MLYRWFLDMEPSFDATVFTKNRRRLLRHKMGRKLFEEVAYEADRRGLMSDEHFSVDGTLTDAAASIRSFRRRDGDNESKGDSGSQSGDFRGEKLSNATHRSTIDPVARLMRKGKGKEAKLVFNGACAGGQRAWTGERRPRLPAAGSRGVGGAVHPDSRALRAQVSGHHLEPSVQRVEEGVREPHGDRGGDRQDRPPLCDPGVRCAELQDQYGPEASDRQGVRPAKMVDVEQYRNHCIPPTQRTKAQAAFFSGLRGVSSLFMPNLYSPSN